jgi:hypothetical protein
MTGPGKISAFNYFSTAVSDAFAKPADKPADRRPIYQVQNFSTRPSVNGEYGPG